MIRWKKARRIKVYASLEIGIILSTVAASVGLAAAGPPLKYGAPPGPAGKADVTHGRRTPPGAAAKTGGRPGAVGNPQARASGSGKGASGISGTGLGAQHSPSINGTGMGAQHHGSISGTAIRARH